MALASRSCFMAAARFLTKPATIVGRRASLTIGAPIRPTTLECVTVRPSWTSSFCVQAFASDVSNEATTSIFVGNLPFSVDDEELRSWFGEIGEVSSVRIALDRDGRKRGFAHIDFVHAASAVKAVAYNGEELNGRALRIDMSAPRAARPVVEADGLTCFVKGFDAYDEDAARSALIEAFSPHGEITEVILPMDRESGRLKGFGYVVFANNDGSNVRAAAALSGAVAAGGRLTTDPNATSKKSAPRGAGDAQGDGKTLFVKGFDSYLGEDAVREELTAKFSTYGEIVELRLPFDRDNACLKGFGYIVFADANGAPARAAEEMTNVEVAGGSLFLDPNPRPPRAPGGGRGGGRGGSSRGGGGFRGSGGRGGGYERRDSNRGGYNNSYGDDNRGGDRGYGRNNNRRDGGDSW